MCDCYELKSKDNQKLIIENDCFFDLNLNKFGLKNIIIELVEEDKEDYVLYELWFAKTLREKKILKLLAGYTRTKYYTEIKCVKFTNSNLNEDSKETISDIINKLNHEGCEYCEMNNLNNWYFLTIFYKPINLENTCIKNKKFDILKKNLFKLQLEENKENKENKEKNCLCYSILGNKRVKFEQITEIFGEELRNEPCYIYYNEGGLFSIKDIEGNHYDHHYFFVRNKKELNILKTLCKVYSIKYYTEFKIKKTNNIIYKFQNKKLNKINYWYVIYSPIYGMDIYHGVEPSLQECRLLEENLETLINTNKNNFIYDEDENEIPEKILWMD
jgi:hypothetical protein